MTIHEFLILWTARIAVVCMLIRVVLSALRRNRHPSRIDCIVWTGGFGVFLLHVAAAFQFQHGWSHAAAYRFTAEQTAAVTGWDWGGGLYLNYLFTLLWGVDVAWDWYALQSGRAFHPWIRAALRGFLAFVAINATVVFGHPGWWLVAAAFGAGMLIIRLMTSRRLI